jgi:hypothetical protein
LVRRADGVPDGRGAFTLDAFAEGPDYFVTAALSADPDPLIDYSVSASNFSSAPMSFVFAFFNNYVGGPYDTLTSSHSSTAFGGGSIPNHHVIVTRSTRAVSYTCRMSTVRQFRPPTWAMAASSRVRRYPSFASCFRQ